MRNTHDLGKKLHQKHISDTEYQKKDLIKLSF